VKRAEKIAKAICQLEGVEAEDEPVLKEGLETILKEETERKWHDPSGDEWLEWD